MAVLQLAVPPRWPPDQRRRDARVGAITGGSLIPECRCLPRTVLSNDEGTLRREREMTRTELLDKALKNLTQVVKLLDRAEEDELASDALELAERVNFRMQSSCHMRPL